MLGQQLLHDPAQPRRQFRPKGGQWHRLLPLMRERDRQRGGANEWRPAREEVIDAGSEGIEIASHIHRPARRLLRAHVERCAERHPLLRQFQIILEHPRQTEVGDLHLTGRRHEEVFGLDVAVHDPGLRRLHQR